jgi:hypothetical protein
MYKMHDTFSNTLFYLQPIFLCYQVKLYFNIFYELLGQNGLVIVLNLLIKYRLLLKKLEVL